MAKLSISALLERARNYGLGVGRSARGAWLGRRSRADSDVLLDEAFLRRLERLNLLVRQPTRSGTVGEHRSRLRAASLEFADYRRYVSGDDLRRVDWNVYGRLGHFFVKLTEATEDVALHLLLDCSQSMSWGRPSKLLYARQLVAALGYLSLSRFDAVTIATFSDRIQERFPLTRGKGQTLSMLGFLNDIQVGGTTDLDRALSGYCTGSLRSGTAVIVSDLLGLNAQHLGVERLLQAGLEVTVLHLLHAQELRPELAGELELVDVETGELVEITVGQEAIRSYEERLSAWRQSLREGLLARGVNYVLVDTSVPLESLILQQLRRRRVIR